MSHIKIEFNNSGQAIFDIATQKDSEVATALLGLEGWFAGKTGLDLVEIREILDEMKDNLDVKPTPVEDVTDV